MSPNLQKPLRVIGLAFVLGMAACRAECRCEPTPSVGIGAWPDSVFETFLSSSVITRATMPLALSRVYTEGWEQQGGAAVDLSNFHSSRWLADYQILSLTLEQDSGYADTLWVRATALITTVAREEGYGFDWGSNGVYLAKATMKVEEDTAHWEMRNGTPSGGVWMVVGGSIDGFSLETGTNRITEWSPPGASKLFALALADSIRRARGHPILR